MSESGRKKRKKSIKKRNTHPIRRMDVTAILIVWLFIIVLWVTCISGIINGNFIGHVNYYGQPVGYMLLLVFLIVSTCVCLIMTVRTIKKRKVEYNSTPEWMNEPPWKWPWN